MRSQENISTDIITEVAVLAAKRKMVSIHLLDHGQSYNSTSFLSYDVENVSRGAGNLTGIFKYDDGISVEQIVFCILCVLGLLANILSFVAILNIQRISPRMILICNLAVVDGLVFLFLLLSDNVQAIYDCHNSMDFVFLTLLEMSCLTLLALGLEMYIAVCRPLHYSSCITKRWSWSALALIWGFDLGKLLILILSDVHDFCNHETAEAFKMQTEIQYYGSVLIFATCLAASTIFYIRIFLDVRSNQWAYDKSRRLGGSGPNKEDRQRHIKTTVTLFLLYGTLALSWGPWALTMFLSKVFSACDPKICQYVMITFTLLVLLNSLLDPIIYGIRLPDIRQGYRRIFRKCCGYRPTNRDYDLPSSRSCNSTRVNSTSF